MLRASVLVCLQIEGLIILVGAGPLISGGVSHSDGCVIIRLLSVVSCFPWSLSAVNEMNFGL